MSSLQRLQTPIHAAIANELIGITPDTWDVIEYRVEHKPQSDGHFTIGHTILSPDGHRDLIAPSDLLFAEAKKLFDVFAAHGEVWKRTTYLVSLNEEGAWGYKVNFEY